MGKYEETLKALKSIYKDDGKSLSREVHSFLVQAADRFGMEPVINACLNATGQLLAKRDLDVDDPMHLGTTLNLARRQIEVAYDSVRPTPAELRPRN